MCVYIYIYIYIYIYVVKQNYIPVNCKIIIFTMIGH